MIIVMGDRSWNSPNEKERRDAFLHNQDFWSIVETLPDLIARFDKDLQLLYINPVIEHVTDFSREELIGKTIQALGMPEDTVLVWENVLKAVFQKRQEKTLDSSFSIKNGTWFYSSRFIPEFGFDGSVQSVLCIARDVTDLKRTIKILEENHIKLERSVNERTTELLSMNQHLQLENDTYKRTEAVLRERAEMLRSILISSPNPILVADMYGNIVECNERALEQYSAPSKEDFLNRNAFSLVAPQNYDQSIEDLKKIAEQGAIRNIEYLMRTSDGHEFPGELSAGVIKDTSGNPVGFIAIIHDITKRKQIEVMLEKYQEHLKDLVKERTSKLEEAKLLAETANHAKSNFLAHISHELRTPLNAIIGFTQVLQDGVPGPINDEQQTLLVDILQSSHHLLGLINDLLDISKIEAGKISLNLEDFLLKPLLDACLFMFEKISVNTKINLSFELPTGIEKITADPKKMRQILFNLLSNAVKFTPDGGKVGIKVENRESDILFTVWDTGIGITPAKQQKLFLPFQQLEGNYSRTPDGTGLGLFYVKTFVDLHNGMIWVESEEGKGSQFYFTIPKKVTKESYCGK